MELLVLAIAPGLALLLFFYLKDKYDKEPLWGLVKTFLLGAVITIPAALVQIVSIDLFGSFEGNLLKTFIASVFIIAVSEEIAKYTVLRYYAFRKPSFNEPYDGIMYSVAAALGFATVENILYVLNSGLAVAFLRAVLAVPGHALDGVLMGYYVGLAKFTDAPGLRRRYVGIGLGLAIAAHGLYDFFLLSQSILLVSLVLPLVAICWRFTFRAIRLHAEASPFAALPKS